MATELNNIREKHTQKKQNIQTHKKN